MLKHILRHTIFLFPPIMLFISFLTIFFEPTYEAWFILGNSIGFSLLTDLVFVYVFFFNRNYCWFTKISVLGLLAMNVFDLLASFFVSENYELYSFIYNIVIVTIVVFLGIYYTIQDNDFN